MALFPSVDLTNFDLAPAARTLRDAGTAVRSGAVNAATEATYTAVGLSVLAYQRIQVRRREIERELRR
jgi:hypothetical protein